MMPIPSGTSGIAEAVKQHRSGLLAFIRRRVRVPEDAEDIVQNVFYQFAKTSLLLQPVELVTAWLYKVARNQIIDLSRKKKEEPLPAWLLDDNDAEQAALDSAALNSVLFSQPDGLEAEYLHSLFWEALEDALEELPDNQREVFEKTELHGYSFKQLAEESGMGVNTLLSRKRYAVLHLRKRLRAVYEEMIV